MRMDLSIVIVNWNTRDLLDHCLGSLGQTLLDIPHEVVVVDNGSTDGSVDLIQDHYPETVLIDNPDNRGFAAAVNQGIRASSGKYVLFLNSDATPAPDAVSVMVRHLDGAPSVGAVGGRLMYPDGRFQSSYMSFPSLLDETLLLTGLSRWVLPATYPSAPEERSHSRRVADWMSGAFLMLRRAAIDDIGTLDEAYFMYAEEMDWCWRAKKHGWEVVYLPSAQATHQEGGTSRRVPLPKRAQIYRSKWLFMRKHRGRVQAGAFALLVWTFSVLKLGAWALQSRLTAPDRRGTAHRNIGSYRYLLARFPNRV